MALALALLFAPAGARAEFTLEPAYPATPLHGPQAAKGAVIWNHGINFLYGVEGASAGLPLLLLPFRDGGWDTFRLLRPRVAEEPRHSRDEILAAVGRLRGQGYARIVLAGQSGGAWLALMAAAESDAVDAVIANAPAWYGSEQPGVTKNGFLLNDYLGDVRRARIMISFFADDPFDPGGRGAWAEAILAAHGVPHVVIDRPSGFAGHNAGDGGLFLRRFGGCAVAVAGNGAMPTRDACDSGFGNVPSPALRLPAHVGLAKPDGGAADPYLGKWYGVYGNGRELMLVIERAHGGKVEALYAYGGGPDPAWKAGYSHRAGLVAGDSLLFAETGKSTLGYRVLPGGGLAAQWTAPDGGAGLQATLHRLP